MRGFKGNTKIQLNGWDCYNGGVCLSHRVKSSVLAVLNLIAYQRTVYRVVKEAAAYESRIQDTNLRYKYKFVSHWHVFNALRLDNTERTKTEEKRTELRKDSWSSDGRTPEECSVLKKKVF